MFEVNKFTGISYILTELDFETKQIGYISWNINGSEAVLIVSLPTEAKRFTCLDYNSNKDIGILIEDIRKYLESYIPVLISDKFEYPKTIEFKIYNFPNTKYDAGFDAKYTFILKDDNKYLCTLFNNHPECFVRFRNIIKDNSVKEDYLIKCYFYSNKDSIPVKLTVELFDGSRIGSILLLYSANKIISDAGTILDEIDDNFIYLNTDMGDLMDTIYNKINSFKSSAVNKLEINRACLKLIELLQGSSQEYNKGNVSIEYVHRKIRQINYLYSLISD